MNSQSFQVNNNGGARFHPKLVLNSGNFQPQDTSQLSTSLFSYFQCEELGFYPDEFQCDKYYVCGVDAEPVETRLCPDGLVFDRSVAPKSERCNYPFLADCPIDATQRKYA